MRPIACVFVAVVSTASTAWGQQARNPTNPAPASVQPALALAPETSGTPASPAPSAPPSSSSASAAPSAPPPAERAGQAPMAPADVVNPPCITAPTVLPQPMRECAEPGPRPGLRVARIALELVVGGAMGAPAELSGAYVGLSADVAAGNEAGAGMAIGTALGAFGVAPGVWLAGYAMGGDGSLGWTVLGDAVGITGSSIWLAIDSTPPSLVVAALLPVVGSIAGYELSSHDRRSGVSARRRRADNMVVPTASPTSFGVRGVF